MCSHKDVTPPDCMCHTEMGGGGGTDGRTNGRTDAQMSSVRSIRSACSAHKRSGRRLEEIPVASGTDVGGSR